MQIGEFRRTGDHFTGRLQTLAIDAPLRIMPVAVRANEKAPDWRIHLDDDPDGPPIGSGWTHEGDGRFAFVAVQIDCPTLARPLRASLRPTTGKGEHFVLLWARSKAK